MLVFPTPQSGTSAPDLDISHTARASDHLRKLRVRAAEDDIGIGSSRNMDEIWASLKRFEVREHSK